MNENCGQNDLLTEREPHKPGMMKWCLPRFKEFVIDRGVAQWHASRFQCLRPQVRFSAQAKRFGGPVVSISVYDQKVICSIPSTTIFLAAKKTRNKSNPLSQM